MTTQHRRFILTIAGSVRGRFMTRWHAEQELQRLEHLAAKRNESVAAVARILVEPEKKE